MYSNIRKKIDETLAKITLEHREEHYQHHSYDDDMHQYELIQRGDLEAVTVGKKMFEGPTTGKLSEDPYKNYLYLFIASITLACRFCIEGGMSSEEAFNLSDLYIRQADQCHTAEELFELHDTMFRDYTTRMQQVARRDIYSRQVHLCLDLIDQHLQEPLTVASLAKELSLSPSYLSVVFKQETGIAVSEYIRRRRITVAKELLQYTEFSCLEIAEYLCFSSDSHFSKVFRDMTGQTPTDYRKEHYQKHWE